LESITEIKAFFWIGTLVMLISVLVLLFLVLFYKNYFARMKRMEAELLLKASLDSEKKERQRIAADLHDSVSSDLSAIRNYLVVLIKSEKEEDRVAKFEELKDGVEVAIENTRQVSYKLMPPLLENLGFVLALDDYLQQLNQKTAISFTLVGQNEVFDLPLDVGYELYRVVQEFITNMLKYGEVKNCMVVLYIKNSVAYIELVDDGVPYDFKKELAHSKGTGLKNISSRLSVIKATLEQREVVKGNHMVISLRNSN
jgi:signal transduction histidine kinase